MQLPQKLAVAREIEARKEEGLALGGLGSLHIFKPRSIASSGSILLPDLTEASPDLTKAGSYLTKAGSYLTKAGSYLTKAGILPALQS